MPHHVQWTAPAPMWGRSPDLTEARRRVFGRPAILRFATDSFMEEFNRVLETDPSKLSTLEAQFETWRGPGTALPVVAEPTRTTTQLERKLTRMRGSAERRLAMFGMSSGTAVADAPPPAGPSRLLKLYQPAHQRFYLVAAALVCQQPGLPDRTIDSSREEKTSFVLRRIRTRTVGSATVQDEYGFVADSNGGSWAKIASPETTLAPGEDKRPLFGVSFQDDASHKRRVLAGLIPAGRREQYVGGREAAPASSAALEGGAATLTDPGAPPPPIDPRIALLSADVIEPWKALVVRAAKAVKDIGNDQNDGKDKNGMYTAARENIQVGSWYVLLDFATFLSQHLGDVWASLVNNTTPTAHPQRDIVLAIRGAALTLPSSVPSYGLTRPANLAEALAAVVGFGDRLEQATGGFSITAPTSEWPTFQFPLADAEFGGPEPAVTPTLPPGITLESYQIVLRKISALRDLIAAGLPSQPTAPVPDMPLAAQPVMAPDETAVFVIRCLFEQPECTPLHPPVLSAPSRPFELASFFDPEAPARPIRISLPVDTSPAGLRRAPKNTAFMVSDMLCGQINSAKGMGLIDLVLSFLPFPLHKDLDTGGPTPCKTDTGASLGMICSLSLPIITICALILLIIMVSLFDLIFRWLPYFIFCFPLPKFSAKAPLPQEPA